VPCSATYFYPSFASAAPGEQGNLLKPTDSNSRCGTSQASISIRGLFPSALPGLTHEKELSVIAHRSCPEGTGTGMERRVTRKPALSATFNIRCRLGAAPIYLTDVRRSCFLLLLLAFLFLQYLFERDLLHAVPWSLLALSHPSPAGPGILAWQSRPPAQLPWRSLSGAISCSDRRPSGSIINFEQRYPQSGSSGRVSV
jgi:hypothetical protein